MRAPTNLLGLLKSFIRELPGSPIPSSLSEQFVAMANKKSDDVGLQISFIKEALKELSANDYELLRTLCEMLQFIASHHEQVGVEDIAPLTSLQNKMTASNLAVVWAPNIFQTDGDNFEFANITSYVEVFTFMIQHTSEIFSVSHPSSLDLPPDQQ